MNTASAYIDQAARVAGLSCARTAFALRYAARALRGGHLDYADPSLLDDALRLLRDQIGLDFATRGLAPDVARRRIRRFAGAVRVLRDRQAVLTWKHREIMDVEHMHREYAADGSAEDLSW